MSWKPPTSVFEVKPLSSWSSGVPHYKWPDPPKEFEIIEEKKPLLDKEGLASHILSCAQEHFVRNGVRVYAVEARDRVSLLKLYAEVMGFTGKNDTTTNTFTNNEMKVVLVKPEEKISEKELKTIETKVEKLTNITPLRIKAV